MNEITGERREDAMGKEQAAWLSAEHVSSGTEPPLHRNVV